MTNALEKLVELQKKREIEKELQKVESGEYDDYSEGDNK